MASISEVLRDFTNNEIREILQASGLVMEGEEVSAADYEATLRRADILLKSYTKVSPETALAAAFFDRRNNQEQTGLALLSHMEPEQLKDWVESLSGNKYSIDEVQALVKYLQQPENQQEIPSEVILKWMTAREGIGVDDRTAVIDGTGNVVAQGENPIASQKDALENIGRN